MIMDKIFLIFLILANVSFAEMLKRRGGTDDSEKYSNRSESTPPPITPSTPLDKSLVASPAVRSSYTGTSKATDNKINFSIYFDLLLMLQPRSGNGDLSFNNFHPFLLAEVFPDSNLLFSFEVSSSPKYFELSYLANERWQIRFGKIYIPFDDLQPHDVFGGRVNASRMRIGSTAAFLPDLWTDLGVAAKWTSHDTSALLLDWQLFVGNGFRNGGTTLDPVTPKASAYPTFADLPIAADNNNDKSIGARVHALMSRQFGLGLSFYTARWTDESDPPKRVNILGIDSQWTLGKSEIRAGVAKFFGGLLNGDLSRQGEYVEFGQKFGEKDEWKLLLRGGHLDLDARIEDANDQLVGGFGILYKPGLLQYALEHYQDFKKVASKSNYSFTALKVAMQF